jgi:hypothetical protein
MLFLSHINSLTTSHLTGIIERKGFTNTKRKRKKCEDQSLNFVWVAASHSVAELMQKLVRLSAASVFSVPSLFTGAY